MLNKALFKNNVEIERQPLKAAFIASYMKISNYFLFESSFIICFSWLEIRNSVAIIALNKRLYSFILNPPNFFIITIKIQ
jgi:hypothetical protein